MLWNFLALMRKQIQLVDKVMIKAIKRGKMQNPLTIYVLLNTDKQALLVLKTDACWSCVETARSDAYYE